MVGLKYQTNVTALRTACGHHPVVRGALITVCMATLAVASCGDSHPSSSATTKQVAIGMKFVRAPSWLIVECHETARAVGYPVPCPMEVPAGLIDNYLLGPTGCKVSFISAGCPPKWRGWVVGSSTTPTEHLVLTASPAPLRSYAKVINGPAWYPAARVKPVASLTINGWQMRAVFGPQATNDGSAFANHVVLVWTVGHHTYGVGFHDVSSIQQTLLRDEKLARSIRLVAP